MLDLFLPLIVLLYKRSHPMISFEVFYKLIDFSFNGGEHNLVTISKHGASWSKD